MTVPQKERRFVPAFVITVLLIVTIILVAKQASTVNGRAGVLRALGYTVEATNATFRGFSSQIIVGSNNNEHITLQVVRNVSKDNAGEIVKEFNNTVDAIQQKVVITDPYSGRQQDLSLPEALKPVREDVVIRGDTVLYYLVYANEIYSLKIFSEAEATHKGIFSTYYCPKEKIVYKLEYFSGRSDFIKEKGTSLLSSLYCK